MREMKLENVTILFIITAILFAGCTGTDEPGVQEQVQQKTPTSGTSSGTTNVTPVSPVVTTVQITATENTVRIFNGEFTWVEYRENNTVTMPPNPRYQWEYVVKNERTAESYKGIPAIHEKITLTGDHQEWIDGKPVTTKTGDLSVADLYFDRSTNRLLGGSMIYTIPGMNPAPKDIPADEQYCREDKPRYEMGISPFGEMNITLVDQGTESVTVPAGTYPDTRKYFGKFHDGSRITFWVAPAIPVPVQYQFQNKYMDGEDPIQTFELMGWG